MARWWLVVWALGCTLPTLAAATPVPDRIPDSLLLQLDAEPEASPLQPSQVGLDYLLGLPQNLGDPGYVHRALLAQFESQGALEPGTVHVLEDGPSGARGSPGSFPAAVYKDVRLVCDLDGDGVADLIDHEYEGSSRIFALSGKDGEVLWARDNNAYVTLSDFTRFMRDGQYPARRALPNPQDPINVAPHVDLNGDGVCDTLALGYTGFSFGIGVRVALLDFHITALDGKTGMDLWRREWQSKVVFEAAGLVVEEIVAQVRDFPTGLEAFTTPNGPRFVYKTTDLNFVYVREPQITNQRVFDLRVSDHVYYLDATNGEAEPLWTRDLLVDDNHGVSNFTWISGVADLAGTPEAEVVLDIHWITTPRGNQNLDDPTTGRPLFRYGRGMSMLTLRGEDGLDHWKRLILDEGKYHVNLQTEEPWQTLVWTFAQILPDQTGDGRADVFALYLAQEQNDDSTLNGRFRTHVVPIDGANGRLLWNQEFRGWGFVASLSATDQPAPFVALGTVDPPIPGEIAAAGRFPPKFSQLRVLNMNDGTPVWSHEEQFSQDSYLPYHLALAQFLTTLAPFDWDGDGLRELVGSARYNRPTGLEQGLLSTATHSYRVLSGQDGEVLRTITTWGSNGRVVACPGNPEDLTVVSGHARRIDATRLDVETGKRIWRRPLYNDGMITSATRGADFLLLGARCADPPEPDARTMVAFNLFRNTPARNFEIVPVHGFVRDNGTTDWLIPEVIPDPGILSFTEMLPTGTLEAGPTETAVVNLGPAVIGLGTGVGIGFMRNRARRKGGAA